MSLSPEGWKRFLDALDHHERHRASRTVFLVFLLAAVGVFWILAQCLGD